MSGILIATIVVGITGIIIGFFLCFASEKFKVEVDPKEEAILKELPGNNCGGCGFAGCSGCAAAIAQGKVGVGQCPVGGEPVAEKIAAIMGVDAVEEEKQVAYVRCAGNCEKAVNKYDYNGIEDCIAASQVPGGGPKACSYGCLGFGSCVKACPFDAIHIVDGIAYVDKEACKACGKCVAICPRHMIELIPYNATYAVACQSHNKGVQVSADCKAGCIACHMCERVCENDAVHVEDNLAAIDQSKCIGCGKCAEKCPKHVIFAH